MFLGRKREEAAKSSPLRRYIIIKGNQKRRLPQQLLAAEIVRVDKIVRQQLSISVDRMRT